MVHEGSGPKPVLERQQQVGSKPFNPGPAAAQLSACGEFNEFKGLEKEDSAGFKQPHERFLQYYAQSGSDSGHGPGAWADNEEGVY